MRPHIGLNADYTDGSRPYHKLYAAYTGAVRAAGGVPVILPSMEDDEDILSVLSSLDGFVLTGGRDLHPSSYGEEPHPSTAPVAPERQAADERLVEMALVMEMPILGICLGLQLLNVHLGGTLMQDLPSEIGSTVPHNPAGPEVGVRHTVRVEGKSRLYSIVKSPVIEVDSSHHQAVRDLGRSLAVSARSEDGVIEAIEIPSKWVVAVQWHPERTIDEAAHLALFQALVAAAGG